MSFHAIGFFIPLLIGLLYALRTLRWTGFFDWILVGIAMAVSCLTITTDAVALHMVEAYAFVAVYYLLRNQHIPLAKHPPAGSLVTLFFLSILVPDVFGGLVYADGRPATVGGAGVMDGLLLWPLGSATFYLLACAIGNVPVLNNGNQAQSWRQFLSHHLTL